MTISEWVEDKWGKTEKEEGILDWFLGLVRDSLSHSDERAFVLAEVRGHSQASSSNCKRGKLHQRHHVGTLGEWRS